MVLKVQSCVMCKPYIEILFIPFRCRFDQIIETNSEIPMPYQIELNSNFCAKVNLLENN